MILNKQRKLFSLLMLLMGLLMTILLWSTVGKRENSKVPGELDITKSGFYSENLLVEVKVPFGSKVYYTSDGSEPTEETAMLYQKPFTLTSLEKEELFTYRFRVYYPNGDKSEIYTRSYFLGERVSERYTTRVLSVVGDPDGLFGYENGIFVKGKVFDEWKTANPNAFYGGGVDANFQWRGREYERPVHVECFDERGNSLFALNAGVRMHGAFSRMKNQKSFRIYARKEYDDINEISYPVVETLNNMDGTLYDRYKRLLVRNSGGDNGFGFIRGELGGDLANDAGFSDVCVSAPVCVYMNGEYKGIYWMGNNFSTGYFEEKYGEYPGEFVVLEGTGFLKKEDEDPEVQKYVEEYNELFRAFFHEDLTNDETYEKLCRVFDVENYIQYCAFQIYIGNVDWPANNVRVYRYVSPTGEYEEGTVFDGRYRNLLYDLDFGLGLLLVGGGEDETSHTLIKHFKSEHSLLYGITRREDCRDYFVNYFCDLMNGALSADNIKTKLAEKHASRQKELYYMLEETDLMEDSLWNWEGVSIYYDNVEKNYHMIEKFAENRQSTMLYDVYAAFGFDPINAYTLTLQNHGLSSVKINSLEIEESEFRGVYFGEVPVVLTPNLAMNERFGHWIVNGEVRTEDKLVLTTADIREAAIHVEVVTHPVEDAVLEIHAVKARGANDYVEIINYSDRSLSTKGYYLTDREDGGLYSLPNIILHPGETVRFYGKDATTTDALGSWGLNFNLKQGEILRLYRAEEEIDLLIVPELTAQGVYQKNHTTGVYREMILKEE